ncbi:hypothetical protein BD324DRAFT_19338 [Kockovaella imperatae]|uniref:Uncharacterized protein n=1 Tax=Kockovaella imperatae TaxID=4999 RepID=A0A1Y1US09_9TREE|nr:hypothetical protein BD324DRAFT_19338 [Kockovaella imperatae]ORX40759.1 hypothetical protein BD324DRAFT_19338 [Kockovaella imperatae]
MSRHVHVALNPFIDPQPLQLPNCHCGKAAGSSGYCGEHTCSVGGCTNASTSSWGKCSYRGFNDSSVAKTAQTDDRRRRKFRLDPDVAFLDTRDPKLDPHLSKQLGAFNAHSGVRKPPVHLVSQRHSAMTWQSGWKPRDYLVVHKSMRCSESAECYSVRCFVVTFDDGVYYSLLISRHVSLPHVHAYTSEV